MRKYMMSGNLWKRVEDLEKHLFVPEVDFGEFYDAIKEMDRTISPPDPASPTDDFEQRFIEENGTREEFIARQRELHKTFYG